MSERVTWLLPVRNGMPFLSETLASIERQTYRHWEVLAWDNGSTDGTVAELERWIPKRLRGRVVANCPLSLGNSLAALVEMAESELCARIDADDLNLPERLSRQVDFLLEHPQVGAVGTQIEFIDEQGRGRAGAWAHPCGDAEIRWTLRWANALNHPTVLFRRSVVLAAGNYADCMPYEDYDLWIRMARLAEIANLPEALVKYRVSSTSVSGTMNWRSPVPLFDAVAARHPELLFDGLSDAEALSLRLKFQRDAAQPVKVYDLFRLYRAATATAVAAGKPPSYFRATRLYAEQQKDWLRRRLRQQAWGRICLAAKAKLHSLLSTRGDEQAAEAARSGPHEEVL
jgi:hypothetical protein